MMLHEVLAQFRFDYFTKKVRVETSTGLIGLEMDVIDCRMVQVHSLAIRNLPAIFWLFTLRTS